MSSDMRIGITSFGADGGTSGISTYLTRTLHEWSGLPNRPAMELLTHRSEAEVFRTGIPALAVGDYLKSPVVNIAWHQTVLPRLARRRKYDVLFFPAGNRRPPSTLPCASVGTVHDLSSFRVNAKYDRLRTFYVTRVLPRLMRRLTRIITASQNSKRDIVEYAGIPEERINVVPNGLDHSQFRLRPEDEVRERVGRTLGVHRPYVLYVSRVEHPGKNHVRIVALEPNLVNHECLITNLGAAGITQASPYRLALGGRAGVGAVRATTSRSIDHRLVRADHDAVDAVPTVPLRGLLELAKSDSIAFLKMDIEGAGREAFLSTDERTLKCFDRIALEYHDDLVPGTLACLQDRLRETHSTKVVPMEERGYGMLYATRRAAVRPPGHASGLCA